MAAWKAVSAQSAWKPPSQPHAATFQTTWQGRPEIYTGCICRRFLWPSFSTNGFSQSASATSNSAISRTSVKVH